MVNDLELKLKEWTKSANDDIDLRTDAGLEEFAVRHARRRGVSIEVARQFVAEEMTRRRTGTPSSASRVH